MNSTPLFLDAPGTKHISDLVRAVGGKKAVQVTAIVLAVCFGSLALYPLWTSTWTLWSEDPLRSIGMFFPPLSLLGTVWIWKRLRWNMEGSFWGIPLIVLSIVAARAFNVSSAEIVFRGHNIGLLHPGLALFCYGTGTALLFGGPKLVRKAILPLCLLLLINPVPRSFNTLFDLPLQEFSANTARAFAHAIGLRPTGVQLQMMFTPDFGMMIVPGCNGIRGSVTFGYMALMFAYYRGLSARFMAALALSAIFFGYLINLVRLCVLVIYYRIGISIPFIQDYGIAVDYAIGCTLFLLAAIVLGAVIRYCASKYRAIPDPALDAESFRFTSSDKNFYARALCFAVIASGFVVPQLKAISSERKPRLTEAQAILALPHSVGSYTLVRSWAEYDTNDKICMLLSDYVEASSKEHLTFGLWLANNNHLVANSKRIQGLVPTWTGSFDAATRESLPAHFVSALYNDGVTYTYDAETACASSGCDEILSHADKGGFLMGPRLADLLVAPTSKRLPILLTREWLGVDKPTDALRREFEVSARKFMSNVDMRQLLPLGG